MLLSRTLTALHTLPPIKVLSKPRKENQKSVILRLSSRTMKFAFKIRSQRLSEGKDDYRTHLYSNMFSRSQHNVMEENKVLLCSVQCFSANQHMHGLGSSDQDGKIDTLLTIHFSRLAYESYKNV